MTPRTNAAAALAALALVMGCSSEAAEEPEALPSVPAAAPSPAASTANAVPPSAQAETPQAAAAFARFFYAEIGRAFAERDPAPVERLSAPGCESCQLFINSIGSLRQKNERVTPVEFKIVAAEAPALTGDEARVDVIYDLDAVQRLDAGGRVVFEEPTVRGREIQLLLVRSGQSWLVKSAEAV